MLKFPKPFLVWCVGFAYAAFLALTLQKLLLPLMPSLHAGHGLLQNDAIIFHEYAVKLANKIHANGWSEWKLFPAPGITGNVGVLAALYVFFGPDPVWFIPVNAAAHAAGALMLYLIGPLLWPGNVGRLGGLVAAGLFLLFPSALLWYGQNHKDAFATAGTLIILYAWLRALSKPVTMNGTVKGLALSALGTGLFWSVRPHMLQVCVAAMLVSWVLICLTSVFQKSWGRDWRGCLLAAAMLVLVASAAVMAPKDRDLEVYGGVVGPLKDWSWQRSEAVPGKLDSVLERVSRIRAYFVAYGRSVNAGSMIDADQTPDNLYKAVAYMPRALFVGLFAPFPSDWTDRPTLIRVISALETLVWYLFAPGIAVLATRRPSRGLVAAGVICAALLLVNSYVTPNLGTLYRVRFGVLFFFVLCGALGWAHVVLNILSQTAPKGQNSGGEGKLKEMPEQSGLIGMAASGAVVILLSFAGFLGLFVRDLLLVKNFGMTAQLDAFFAAVMVPMFLAAFLSHPTSDAMTAPFLKTDLRNDPVQRVRLVRSMLTFLFAILVVGGLVLMAGADEVVRLVMRSGDGAQLEEAAAMLRWFIPVLVFSGWAVVGNCVLNALRQSRTAAMAQLAVPVFAITAILFFYDTFGLYAAIYGMLAGMAVNIAWVIWAVGKLKIPLLPGAMHGSPAFDEARRNYRLLALAAFLAAIATPVNYAFAGSLGAGSVSAWALGSKMVMLVTGLANVGIGAVILPYLGGLTSQGRLAQIRSDVFFLLMSGTWISIVCTLTIFGFSEPLVVSLFEGENVAREEAVQLSTILKLGGLQLPFVVATTLILKLAAVSGTSSRAVIATGVGLALNIALNTILVPQSGVVGIATASAIASGLSAAYLALVSGRHCGLTLTEVGMLLGGWIALIGLIVALHYHSMSAVVTSAFTLAVLTAVQWWTWKTREHGEELEI